jgi:hypothetical protein
MKIKRILSTCVVGILIALLNPLPSQHAQAANNLVILSDTFHREVNGKFTNDLLGQAISVTGEFYKQVTDAPRSATWLIDPQLIEEILDMGDGYTVLPDTDGAYAQSAKDHC